MTDALAVLDAIPAAQVPAAIARLTARLLTAAPEPKPVEADEWLTAKDVAARLKVPTKFVYANARALGGAKLGRKALRFSARGVRQFAEGRAR